MSSLLITCRAGFESECAQELTEYFAARDQAGFARLRADSGYLVFAAADDSELALPAADTLIFPRQVLPIAEHFTALDPKDRISPLLDWLQRHINRLHDVWVEAPDSPEGEALNAFCRSFESALVARLKRDRWLAETASTRLQLFFPIGTEAFLCLVDRRQATPHRQGILRLRFPSAAPSRSTLKLEEGLLVLLTDKEREAWLQPGMSAVDIGAAPGGWTFQLVQRSLRVSAVDNGPMAANLLDSGLVTHYREDGFRFVPKKAVDWLVCDMVEQPIRVAKLVASWLNDGRCKRALFNLKLPMKKRWQETQLCLDIMRKQTGRELDLRAKQLYHDREEITVYAGPASG